ncbi:efflux RND transporter permease subunit [Rhodopila globiformis]|uniref:Efflux pump membrane transporter n=1 Tax=Rhodopila globiformis TaxID=1071 RepID=A0A2S6NMJ5_RHOGL|nr:efflux RND transporter permease subunit [Rhodopila globiformis]PPQ37300.1 hydrophobe/amphiphile efflux-1 family RND transporter [Rhodopila globiformis]
MLSYFVRRPIFASVISIILVIGGGVFLMTLPIALYPRITPPTIHVTAVFTGANAEATAKTVAIPLEQQINGAPGMIYLASMSNNDGECDITVTFRIGYSLNAAAAEVLTRVNQALSQLPQTVQRSGVKVTKATRQQLAIVVLHGDKDHPFDQLFLSNWAETRVIKALKRVSGMGRVHNINKRIYAMRIWLDPLKMEAYGVDPQMVVNAVSAQNTQVVAGRLGGPPTDGHPPGYTLILSGQERLQHASEYDDIILRARPNGAVVRIKDVGHAELGAEDYTAGSEFSGLPAAAIQLYQVPGANAMQVMAGVRKTMQEAAQRFPPGMTYTITVDRTQMIRASIREVIKTLGMAIVLVIAVIFLFLQNWRATLIPSIAIPVALIGAFMPMALFGFSINTLSLLGLILAVGLVVDDAIVVVENVQRNIEDGKDPKQAAEQALSEVGEPVIATVLVLLALFVPVAFVPGLTGRFYNQFALTIAVAVALSGLVSLTLTPALCALLLKRSENRTQSRWWHKPVDWFNAGLERLKSANGRAIEWLSGHVWIAIAGLVAVVGAAILFLLIVPSGFIPIEDQGFFFVDVLLPKGATLGRTQAVERRVAGWIRRQEGVANTLSVSGQNDLTNVAGLQLGSIFPALKPWSQRSVSAGDLIADVRRHFADDPDAIIRANQPPPVPGLGALGGLTFEIEDRSGSGGRSLRQAADKFIAKVQQLKAVAHAEPTTESGMPELQLDVDRARAAQLGVSLSDLFTTIGTYTGSTFVNLFDRFGYEYHVYVESEASGRRTPKNLDSLTVLNADGRPVRLGSVVRTHFQTGPTAVWHYDTYPTIEVNVTDAPNASSGQVIAAIGKLAQNELGHQYALKWTDVAYQERKTGGYAPIIFALGVIMIFLVLAAQFESWLLPFVIILAVPMGVFGALLALWLRQLDLNIFAQVGLLILVGLAAKNSILLVTFSRRVRGNNEGIVKSAADGARLRLRPILMTSLAFTLGNVPLAIATGAGAHARIAIGTTVIGGMLTATVLVLLLNPVFYIVAERFRSRRGYADTGETEEDAKATADPA